MGQWIGLAVVSLVLAGLLASALVIGRVPGLAELIDDPLFFRRCLVVHVVLSIVIWFYAFAGGLYQLLPSNRESRLPALLAPALAWAGMAAIVLAAGAPGSPPILANYVPVVDHPLFIVGLLLFAAGLLVVILRPVLSPSNETGDGFVPLIASARPGLRAAAIALLLAFVTFYSSWLSTPRNLGAEAYYELVMWGGGHVLQFASVAAMVSVWLILLASLTGREVTTRRTASILFGLLVAPLFVAPLLPLGGTIKPLYVRGFTRLMELGIFPVVTVFLVLSIRAVVRARRRGVRLSMGDPRFSGFVVSGGLTALGFGLGASISGSNTLIPAHYHASIGAVTVAFMAITYLLLEPLGAPIRSPRLRRLAGWQPLLFGVGQMVFAVGFGLAGAYGMMRKTYAAEQEINHLGQTIGLVVMSVGGLVAVAGGLLFLGIVVTAWRHRKRITVVAAVPHHEEAIDERRATGPATRAGDPA